MTTFCENSHNIATSYITHTISMNKTDLIQKIKQLEGLTQDEKAELLRLLNTQKKYGLVWENKPEKVEEDLRQHLPVLTEVLDKRLYNTTPPPEISSEIELFEKEIKLLAPAPNHILIEGDNLHALTALSFTHEGKIDVIYIDPPYNTGNKDFKYNDSFVDKEDSYRHSKWLSFMEKRLKIAKRLLCDTGVIFISIDDNEQAQLKLLCDEVFGEDNFIGEIVWFKKRKGSFLSNQLISLTEYLLPYRKNQPIQLFGGTPNNTESQPIVKRTNAKKRLEFKANLVKTKLRDGIYKNGFYGDGTNSSHLLNDIEVKDNIIITQFALEAPFVWSQEYLNQELEKGTEILINTLNFQVRVIRHNNDSVKAMPSFIDGRELGATNEDAYELLKSIFNTDRLFSYSKPLNLVKKIVESATYFNQSSLILDFFAGSGTTLHAVMQLNAEDGGNRQCILVTNNENNICEEVTYERNKRVIQGYTNAKGQAVAGLWRNNLRYYQSAFVPSAQSEENKRLLTQASTDLLCIKEDCYTELTQAAGFAPTHCRLFHNENGKYMIVIYHSRKQWQVCQDLTSYIQALSGLSEPVRLYGFSPEKENLAADFAEVRDKIAAVALPSAIYQAYRAVFRELFS